jgi:hypothetical protein
LDPAVLPDEQWARTLPGFRSHRGAGRTDCDTLERYDERRSADAEGAGASPRHAIYAYVQVEAQGEIVAATLDGKPFDLSGFSQSARQQLKFKYSAPPDKGFELTLSIRSAAPVKITVQDISNGLPTIAGMTIKPRPAYLMPAPGDWQDPTIVIKSFTFTR